MRHKFINVFFIFIFLISSSCIFAQDHSTKPTEASITTTLKTKIAADPTVRQSKITISFKKGSVVLKGLVDTDKQADSLIELAQSIDGVNDVNSDELKVKTSKHPMSDTAITAKVKGLFIREKIFHGVDIAAMTIHVETKNGTVFLTGRADNQQQVNNAVKLAQSVKGVSKVDNAVVLNSSTKH